jgi:tetratricopeptide (TPR) repeat protein
MRRAVTSLLLVLMVVACAAMAQDDPFDLRQAPSAARRAVFRAETAYNDGDRDRAIALLTEAVDAGGGADHPAVRHRLGVLLADAGRPLDALPHLRAAAEAAPDAAVAWRELGRAAYDAGRHAEAARAFERAGDPGLDYYTGVSWLLADEPERALEQLAPLAAAAPDTVAQDLVQAVVAAAAEADRPAAADAAVDRLLADHPDRAAAWRLAAQQAQLADDLPTAAARLQVAAWLDRSAGLEPTAAQRRHLADLLAVTGDDRGAARVLTSLLDEAPGDAALTDATAAAWRRAHDPDSARVVLRSALSLADPETPATDRARWWLLLGDLDYDQRRWRPAAGSYERALAVQDDLARGWLMLGYCRLRLGETDAADAALARAMQFPETADQARGLRANR